MHAQVGLKLSGFSSRIAALEMILYMIIDRVRGLPKPADSEARKAAAQVRCHENDFDFFFFFRLSCVLM